MLGLLALALAVAVTAYVLGSRGDSSRSGSAPEGLVTKVSECGVDKPVAEPQEVTMTCGDGGVVLHDVDWRYWSTDLALGVGSTSENTCEPSCAAGSFIEHPVNVVLFDAVSNGSGPQFTRATVTYQDDERTYDEQQAITYELSPYKSE